MPVYTIKFEEIKRSNIKQAGSKACTLAEIAKQGFKTPPGFVVTSLAFETFLRQNKINDKLARTLNAAGKGEIDPAGVEREAARLFARSRFSPEIKKQIAESYYELIGKSYGAAPKPLAVRSSFLAEDEEGSSFAGQMTTALNVEGESALFDAVKKCWLSVFSKEVVAYKAARKRLSLDVSGGVLVQTQIAPKWAGVVFPGGTDKDGLILIEAVSSLGETLVSGRANPHRITARAKDEKILEYFSPEGEPKMDDESRKAIIKGAARLFLKFKELGDFEWAYDGTDFYALQGRPVTTGRDEDSPPADDVVWSRVLGEEFWSGTVTPLMFSIIGRAIENNMLRKPISLIGDKYVAKAPYLKLIYNHIYVNQNALEPIILFFPEWALTGDILKMFPSDFRARIKRSSGLVLPLNFPKALANFKKKGAPFWYGSAADNFYKFIDEKSPAIEKYKPPISASPKDYETSLDELCKLLDEYLFISVWGVTYAFLFVPLCAKMIEAWCDPKDKERLTHLALSNLPSDKNFETAKRLNRLAVRLSQLDCGAEILEKRLPWSKARELLLKSQSGKRFMQEFHYLIKEHGHRTPDRDILYQRWGENLEIPFGLICKLASQPTRVPAPSASDEEVAAEIEKALPIRYLNLFSPMKRPTLKTVVKVARRFLPIRENVRFHADFFLFAIRKLILSAAEALRERGVIEENESDLVFFLTREELFGEELWEGAEEADKLLRKARGRRERFYLNQGRSMPSYLFNGEDYETLIGGVEPGESLKGLPASPGLAKGKARVANTYEDFIELKPQEILVSYALDPSWSSVIPQAAGMVTEVGGQLSHGAIIAREYGVPAVVGAAGILSRVSTGDELMIDGGKGLVVIKDKK